MTPSKSGRVFLIRCDFRIYFTPFAKIVQRAPCKVPRSTLPGLLKGRLIASRTHTT